MSLYLGMDANTLEREYNLIAKRGPDFPQLIEAWLARGAAHREATGAKVDLPYGEGEREKLDLFSGGDSNGPVLVYIHGGYWQRGDKNMYSFVTESFIKHGVSVAVLNYNLTPSVRMGQIPPQIRKAVAFLWRSAGDLGYSRDKMFVMGHSAGGHLTAMMMATDWRSVDNNMPVDVVKGGIPISGIFELEPLVHTSLNEGPRMDVAEAVEESPLFIPPLTDAWLWLEEPRPRSSCVNPMCTARGSEPTRGRWRVTTFPTPTTSTSSIDWPRKTAFFFTNRWR